MKRSIVRAALLTLVLAIAASSGESSVNYPPIFSAGSGSMYQIYLGIDGDVALDGVVPYGTGNGPRSFFGRTAGSEIDGVVGYGVGSGPWGYGRSEEVETDGVVDYGVGSGPRSPAQGKTN